MNPPYAISFLCVSLVCLSIGLVVLLNNKKSIVNITYFLITLTTFIWLYSLSFLYITEKYQTALLLGKVKYTAITFIPVFLYHFLVSYLGLKSKIQRLILFFYYAATTIFVFLIWTGPLMITGLYKYSWGRYPIGGGLSRYFVFYFIASFFYFLSTLYYYYRRNKLFLSHKDLLRIKWIFISFFLSAFAIPDFLPYFGIGYKPLGHIAILLFLFCIAYAILRHKLLDIEVVIKKTLIFAGLFTIVYAVFAFFALLGQIFFEQFITNNRWVSMIPSVLIVTIMLRPLDNFLVAVTDRYLFQKKYDYKALLRTFATEVLTVLELDRLIALTEEKLAEIMKLTYCKMIISDNADIKTDAFLKVPIVMNNREIGLLMLGRKKSDEEYTQDDMIILQSLSKALAIAISNANLVDELTRAQSRIAEKDRMATLGTLAAGMAHEIRNPITAIRVFSEYVPDRADDAEFTAKYRNIIANEVDRIDHIIQTLIDFSGEEATADTEAVALGEVIDELLVLLETNQGIDGRIKMVKDIPVNIPRIRVNRKELDEILLNLTENAVHAIEGEGQITFKAEEKGGLVELAIIDTGCGMSEDTVKNIFNPFFTTKAKGFGLGLFVVNQLVKRNGGNISVKSIAGKGTIFFLTFKEGIL